MDRMDFGRVAKCHEINEKLLAELFIKAAEKITDPTLKGAILFLAYDSRKHAEVFHELAREYGVYELDEAECARYTGVGYGFMGLLKSLIKRIEEAKTEGEVIDALKNIEAIEVGLAGLDRMVMIDGLEDEGMRKLYKVILEYIERDEEEHENILRRLLEKYNK